MLRCSKLKLAFALSCLMAPVLGVAQEREYLTGALLEEPEVLDSFPITPKFRSYLPEAVSLIDRMPAVGDQGRQGSCVSWAVGYAARSYYERASHGRQVSRAENLVSPAWLHDLIRVDPSDCRDGAFISHGLEQLKTGAVSLAQYRYDDRQCRTVSKSDAAKASGFRIAGWRRVSTTNLDQIKGQLASGHPVVFGARLNREFQRSRGKTPWRATKDQGAHTGNHAMTLVGYDDRDKLFTFINSWGDDWGKGGYGQMTYATFTARVHSAFVIEPLVSPIKPKPDEPAPRPQPNIKVIEQPDLECARLTEERADGKVYVRGFYSKPEDLERIEEAFGETHDITVDFRPWPQCEALLILANGAADAARLDMTQTQYDKDDLFSFRVSAPRFSSHLHLSYFQADGSVVHLSQSAATNLRTLLPNAELIFGDGQDGRPEYRISGPFGNEMLLAITTKSPLFSAARPQVEEHRDFLSALRSATIDFEEGGGRYYSSASISVTTQETSP